jgi:hypothetical protein
VHNSSTVIQKKNNIRPLFYVGKIMLCFSSVTSNKYTYTTISRISPGMTFFYGNFRKIYLLYHPLPLPAEKIPTFPFVTTPKTKAFHHPPPILPALLRYLATQILFCFYNILISDLETKALHHPPPISLTLSQYFNNSNIVLFLQNYNQRS